MNKQTVIQWLKYVAIAAISFFLLLFVLGGLIFGYYAMKAPTLSEKDLVATTSSKIYDNQNNLIADLGAEKRINVSTDQIPTDLVNAIVAIEDHRFFNHRGVDIIRIGGSFLHNLRGGSQGGSTLTLFLHFRFRSYPITKDSRSLVSNSVGKESNQTRNLDLLRQ